jgi:hypothetical protein
MLAQCMANSTDTLAIKVNIIKSRRIRWVKHGRNENFIKKSDQ